MRSKTPLSFIGLTVFAALATTSIWLQNFLWVALAVWLFEEYRAHHPMEWPKGPFTTATLVLIATFGLSAGMGVDPANSLKTVHKYLVLLALFPLAAMSLGFPRLERLMTAYTAGAAFCAVYGIGKYLLGIEERIGTFSGHYMVFGGLLMAALLVQVHRTVQRPRSVLQWSLSLVMAAALMLTRTRGAWLGFAAGFAWYAFKTRRRLLLYGIIAALLGIALSPSPVKERVRSFWDSRLSYSNMERIHMWRTGWRISRDHPVLGIGQGNMEAVYPQYRVPEAKEPVVGHMHNNFMQVLVQNGWVGLLAYLAWIIAYFRDASRFKPRHPGERSLNEGFIAVFIATLVWGLTEYTFSHQYMMVQVFLLGLQWGLMRGFHNPRTNNTPTN